MLTIGAKVKLSKIKRLLRPKESGRGMHNNKMAVAREKIQTYDVLVSDQ